MRTSKGAAIAAGNGPAIVRLVESLRGVGCDYDRCFELVNLVREDRAAEPLSLPEFDAILYEADFEETGR